jgi:hypothetical protein
MGALKAEPKAKQIEDLALTAARRSIGVKQLGLATRSYMDGAEWRRLQTAIFEQAERFHRGGADPCVMQRLQEAIDASLQKLVLSINTPQMHALARRMSDANRLEQRQLRLAKKMSREDLELWYARCCKEAWVSERLLSSLASDKESEVDRLEIQLTTAKRRRQAGAALTNAPKMKAKSEVAELWLERQRGMHPSLFPNTKFAIDAMRRWPILVNQKVICDWCTRWAKDFEAGRPLLICKSPLWVVPFR